MWTLEHRAELVLDGVGLPKLDHGRQASELSGGQRARLSLAWLLLSQPETLLLDEPTNHLDDDGIAFLTEALHGWPGPVLFASHDRAFIDATTTGIVDLDPRPQPNATVTDVAADGPTSGIGVTRFTDTFTDYLRAREAQWQRWQQQYESEQEQLSELARAAERSHIVGHEGAAPRTEGRMAKKFYADRNAAVVSRRANDFARRLDELRHTQVRKPPPRLEFAGLCAGRRREQVRPAVLVSLSEAAVTGRLPPTSLSIGGDDRFLITGPNGAGKSTLIALLAGQLEPNTGSVTVARAASVGVLTQEVVLDGEATVERLYETTVGEQVAAEVPLRTFGLVAPREFSRRVGSLSVGQQRRLALATVLASPPGLLILDEPTNHLSLDLATALEKQLPQYPGAVVVASHDRWLRRSWPGRRLELR